MRRDALEHADEAENFEALCDGYEARISQLEADNAALMEALKPFAKLSKAEPRQRGNLYEIWGPDGHARIGWEHLHAARKALSAHLKEEASK